MERPSQCVPLKTVAVRSITIHISAALFPREEILKNYESDYLQNKAKAMALEIDCKTQQGEIIQTPASDDMKLSTPSNRLSGDDQEADGREEMAEGEEEEAIPSAAKRKRTI